MATIGGSCKVCGLMGDHFPAQCPYRPKDKLLNKLKDILDFYYNADKPTHIEAKSALLKWHNSKQVTPDEILNAIDSLSPGPPFAIGIIWTSAQIKIIKRKLKEAMDKKDE